MIKTGIKYFDLVSGLSLIIFAICVVFNLNYEYGQVCLLPLCFFVLNFLFRPSVIKLSKNIVFIIIYSQMIIRFILLPLLIAFGSTFRAGYTSSNVDIAIFLMIYEIFFVFIAFYIVANYQKSKKAVFKIEFLKRNLIVIIVLLAGIGFLLTQYLFLLKTNFVWNMSDYFLDQDTREAAKAADNIDGVVFFLVRVVFIIFVLGFLWRLKLIKDGLKCFLSLIVILLNATIIVGSSRLSIVYISLPFIVILMGMYPQFKRKLIIYSSIPFLFIFLIASFIKFSSGSAQATTNDVFNANVFNAYFSGPGNISLGVDAYNTVKGGEGWHYMISDWFQNVPGLAGSVDQNYRTTRIFNYKYYGSSVSADQIIPIQISGLFHFGYIFCFIYGFIFTLLAFYFYRQYQAAKFIGSKYVFLLLCINCSIFMMLNIGSITSNIIIQPLLTLLPLLLIRKVTNAKRI